ncbi:MAG: J domain-containing protein [Armatimonadetes bacterium]|nr:J domain-containing protein [Armatimonadota bacterium]
MSTGRRAYDILRAHVNNQWDRINEPGLKSAWDELNEAVNGPKYQEGAPEVPASETVPVTEPIDQKAIARRILGVEENASFEEIRKAYERLRKRSDPVKFPEGTEERNLAVQLSQRIETAYRILAKDVPSIEKRFSNLEIE